MDAKPGQTICLELEWVGMGDRERMRQQMGGDPPGGGQRGPRMQPPEKQGVWLKTDLASPPAEQA